MDGDSADWIVNKSNRKKDIYKISVVQNKGLLTIKKLLISNVYR